MVKSARQSTAAFDSNSTRRNRRIPGVSSELLNKLYLRGKYEKHIYFVSLGILLAIIFLFVLVLFLNLAAHNAREYNLRAEQRADSYSNQIQLKLEIMKQVKQDIEWSSELREWALADGRENYYLLSIRLRDKIAKLSTRFMNLNFEVGVADMEADSFVITPTVTVKRQDYFGDLFGEQQAERLKQLDETTQVSFVEKDKLSYVQLLNIENRKMMILLSIPIAELFNNDEMAWALATNEYLIQTGADLPSTIEQIEAVPAGGKEFVKAQPMNIKRYRIKDFNWNLILGYHENEMDFSFFMWFFVLPFIILVVLSSIIAYAITRNLYQPVEKLIQEMGETFYNDAGKDEFALLHQKHQTLNQLNQEYKELKQQKEKLIEQRHKREVLLGNSKVLDASDEFSVCVTVISFAGVVALEEEYQIYQLKEAIMQWLKDYTMIDYISIDFELSVFLFEDSAEEEIKGIMRSLLERIDPDDRFNLKIGIGSTEKGMAGLRPSFLNAKKTLDYKYLYDKARVLTIDILPTQAEDSYYYPLNLENKLIHEIIEGKANALATFDEIVEANHAVVHLKPKVYHSFMIMLAGTLHRVMQELRLEEEQLLLPLAEIRNGNGRIGQVKQQIEQILGLVNLRKDDAEQSMAKQLIDYIHANYSDDIMLVDLAEHLNISEKYCSALFKKYVGDNYKHYLNKYRIDQAKILLNQKPELKIQEVSCLVGFNSSNTFIRVFSKYVGQTPKQYTEKKKE